MPRYPSPPSFWGRAIIRLVAVSMGDFELFLTRVSVLLALFAPLRPKCALTYARISSHFKRGSRSRYALPSRGNSYLPQSS